MNRRFVFDTNIIISSVLSTKSKPNAALKKAQKSGIIIFAHPTLKDYGITD
ncbi:MAG: hypothetical protein QNJ33_01905 [Crocosphaera sp.]|nr:hypothetical protein [Crocosphaera sp.]